MRESSILARVRLAAQHLGLILFRNQCGAYMTTEGRFVRFGVASPGGSDLIGWRKHTVRQQDVGRTVAIFTAIETKTAHGRPSAEQTVFLSQVANAGGIAGIARSESDAAQIVDRWVQGGAR